jgi:hypothetical protein
MNSGICCRIDVLHAPMPSNISNEDVLYLTCHHVVGHGLGLALEHVADIALDIQLSTNKPKMVCMPESLETRCHQIRVGSLCLKVLPLYILFIFNLTPTEDQCGGGLEYLHHSPASRKR